MASCLFDPVSACALTLTKPTHTLNLDEDLTLAGPNPDCAALYCATNPSVRGSSGLRFKTWTGAYPKLTQHFAAANLNPADNKWDKVWHSMRDSCCLSKF